MKDSDRYLKFVEWSQEDGCYVGRCPEIMLGGVHGQDEQQVYVELCEVVEEWIATIKEDGDELPAGLAGKNFSGRFNLRLAESLHRRLVVESAIAGKSLNSLCAEILENAVSQGYQH